MYFIWLERYFKCLKVSEPIEQTSVYEGNIGIDVLAGVTEAVDALDTATAHV